MSTKTFPNITPAQFANFRKQAEAQGLIIDPVDSNAGTAQDVKHGVTIDFSYDGVSNLTLVVEDGNKPWWLPADTIWSQLAPYLK